MDNLSLLRGKDVHVGLNDIVSSISAFSSHVFLLSSRVLTSTSSRYVRIARRLEVRKSLDLIVILALGCLDRSKGYSSTEKWSDIPNEGR